MTGSILPDRELAAAVLEAPAGPARDELFRLLLLDLRPLAVRELAKAPTLRRSADPDDLVQGFLVCNLRPDKLRGLLRPVAAGEKPLWPRVRCSFVNFVRSLLRRPGLTLAEASLGTAEGDFDPAAGRDPWPDITERVAAQSAAIRRAAAGRTRGVPWHVVLLLDERVRLARAVAATLAHEDGRTVGNQTVADLAEGLTEWGEGDRAQPFTTQGVTLDEAWQAVCQRTDGRPDRANPGLLAEIVGVSREVWNTWVTRARRWLVRQLGIADARRLFEHWPPGAFAAPPEEAGHA